MIEPGSVFDIPARLAQPPQSAYRYDPPHRDRRWVLVISTLNHCVDPDQLTVVAVLLSSQTEFAGEHDVTLYQGECVDADSIAQGDLIFTLAKEDLNRGRYHGTVTLDTLKKVRAAVARVLDLA